MRKLLITAVACMPVTAWAQDEEQQTADRGLIAGFIQDQLSSAGRSVQIYGFEGALSSRATIDRLTIGDDKGIWLDAQDLVLDWDRSALLGGEIDISELTAGRIEVIRVPQTEAAPPEPTAQPFALPELPVSIKVDQFEIGELDLGETLLGEPVQMNISGQASLAGGEGSANFAASRTDDKQGEFLIDAAYSNATRELDLTMRLEEGPEGLASTTIGLPGEPAILLELQGAGPISDYAANLTIATDGVERLSGDVVLATEQPAEGSTEAATQTFRLDVGGDVTALFMPQYRDFFGENIQLIAEGRKDPDGRVILSDLNLDAQSLDLTGDLAIGADGWPERFRLSGTMQSPDGTPVILPISGPQTEIDNAILDISFDQNAGEAWTANIRANGFRRPGLSLPELELSGGGTISREDGSVTVDLNYAANGIELDDIGTAQALGSRLSGELGINYAEGQPINVRKFTLNGSGIDGDLTATIKTLENEVRVTPDLTLSVQGLGRFATLANLPGLGGSADMQVSGTIDILSSAADITVDAATTDLTVGIEQVDNLIAGDGTVDVHLIRDEEGTRVEDLRIETPETLLRGDLSYTDAILTAAVDVETDAENVFPGASDRLAINARGSLDAEGRVSGDASIARAEDLITVTLSLPQEGLGTINGDLHLTDLSQFAGLTGQSLRGALDARIDGQATRDASEFVIDLTSTANGLGIGNSQVDQLLAGTGRLSGQITREGNQFGVRGLDLSFPNIALTGDLDNTDGQSAADFQLRLADIGMFTPEFSGPLTANGTARQQGENWNVDVSATGPGGTQADIAGTASTSGNLNLNVDGSAPLGLINGLLEPRRLSGLANFNLRINGPAALNSVSGAITTTGAAISAPTLGQSINSINARVTLGGGSADITLTGQSGQGGQISVGGRVGLSGNYPANLNIGLQEIVLRDPLLYETTASGQVTLNGGLTGGAVIGGTINLGRTEVRVPSSTVGSLGSLPEVIHLNTPADVSATLSRAGAANASSSGTTSGGTSVAYPLNLTINAPSRVFIRGRGLDAELGGSVQIGGTTNQVIPSGQFSLIRGRLDILQQRFDLSEGIITLQGDFDPVIRLVAQTEAETGTDVSIIIAGPVSDPTVSFESSPELPQDEVLSQLIFGRDLSSISPLQAVQLAAAVGTLAGRGDGGFINDFRMNAGLDDLDITTDDAGNAAVRAGKYLSENVYTDVTVSADGTSEINLNLDVTNDITAKGSFGSDGETSIGIYYERDY